MGIIGQMITAFLIGFVFPLLLVGPLMSLLVLKDVASASTSDFRS